MASFKTYLWTFTTILLCAGMAACSGNKKDQSSATEAKTQTEISQADSAPTKLNMNTATEAQFRNIPQVGDKMVHEFKEYRPYKSILQFRKEIGKYVDDDQVATYEQYIYVPIRPNDSDIETLVQIPGLSRQTAQKVVKGRPYKNNQAFFDALSDELSESQFQKAKSWAESN